MISRNRWLQAAGTITLVAMLVIAGGCSKQRAKLNISRAEKRLQEALQYNVQNHAAAKAKYDQATQTKTAALNTVDTDPKGANLAAGQAAQLAKEALNDAKAAEATFQLTEANHEVDVMNQNQGSRLDPNLWQEITKLQTKMQEQYTKQKWEKTVEIAKDIKQKVDRLLQEVRAAATGDYVAVQAEYQRLLDEDGEQHAINYVGRVKDYIAQIDKAINPPVKHYVQASQLAKEAIRDASEGITEAKRKRGEIAIEEIQNQLIRAQQLKAEFFKPELWNSTTGDFARLVENFWKKEYDFVLQAADQLKKTADTMIYETRKASAEYARDKLATRIQDLKNKGVPEYLPGKLDPVEQHLVNAEEKLKVEEFETVESISEQAQAEGDSIMKEFRAMADKAITEAAKLGDVADGLYQDMERIFKDVHAEYTKTVDQAVTDQKLATRAELRERLDSVKGLLARAQGQLEAEEYRDTIVFSKRVQDDATNIIAAVYNTVATNVIAEISDQISRYDREGAPEYAAKEMESAKQALEEAKALRAKGDFEQSARQAAVARAEVERAIQAIEVAAAQSIEQADKALQGSNEFRTAELAPDGYARAQQAIAGARQLLENSRLRDARLAAEQAQELILAASRDAVALWAAESRKEAQAQVNKARTTGADIYAAQMLHDADEDLAQANQAYADADALRGQKKYAEARAKYAEARVLAGDAAEQSSRATYRLIDDAEAATVEARAYEAGQNHLEELTQSVLQLNAARDAMEAGQYDTSHRLARGAKQLADRIARDSKKDVFQKRLDIAHAMATEANNKGGRYYRAQALSGLVGEIDKLRAQYNADNFDSSAKSLTEIEAKLQDVLDGTPNAVSDMIANQRDRLTAIETNGMTPAQAPAIADAKKYLRYAEIDFKKGHQRSSYENLLASRRLIGDLTYNQEVAEYKKNVRAVVEDLKTAMQDFDHFLSLRPQVLIGMTKGPWADRRIIAIAGRISPTDFRARVDELVTRMQAIQSPKPMQVFHRDLMDVLLKARAGAIYYERVSVVGEYNKGEQTDLIENAYGTMQQVRKRLSTVEKTLAPPEMAAR